MDQASSASFWSERCQTHERGAIGKIFGWYAWRAGNSLGIQDTSGGCKSPFERSSEEGIRADRRKGGGHYRWIWRPIAGCGAWER